MTVDDLIDLLKPMPRDAEVSICADDLSDRIDFQQVVCVTCQGVSEVLLCEERVVER